MSKLIEQRDFTDTELILHFQKSLIANSSDPGDERDEYFGLSLREIIHEYKYQTLVLFKCCLLQPKMLFFSSHCERLCLFQFALICLVPDLLRNLQDCADPRFDSYEKLFVPPTSLRTSERASLLKYMGLPLQLFGKGSLFSPYTPLQQLDVLADTGTKSYIVGSTNALLLQQKDRYSDILINLDDRSINITSPSLKAVLWLSTSDRRWIDFLTRTVNETWDEAHPGRPSTHEYTGSEEFIRMQFEEYLLALVSSIKYRFFLKQQGQDSKALKPEFQGDPANDFGSDWIEAWMKTDNFRMFQKFTDSHLFDIVEPRHPCAGGLTIEDVQRRVGQQVAELHLDERFSGGKEVIGKHLATGQQRVTSAFNNLWAEIDTRREAQRKKVEERTVTSISETSAPAIVDDKLAFKGPETQATVQAATSRAGTYLSSWGAWAAEKRNTAWNRSPSSAAPTGSLSTGSSPKPAASTGMEKSAEQSSKAGENFG